MKKLVCLCLFLCLLGCQSKPKEEKKGPIEEVTKTDYTYQVEPFTMDSTFNDLLSQYPNSRIRFYKALNNQLLFGFMDPTCTDQVGRTQALYTYHLETHELVQLLPEATNIYVNDAIVFNEHYLYMLKDKDRDIFTILSVDATGQQKVLYEETNVGFMQHLKFDIGEDELYFKLEKEITNTMKSLIYKKINKDFEIESILEKKVEIPSSSLLMTDKQSALYKNEKTFSYFLNGVPFEFTYEKETMNIALLKNYIILNEQEYMEIETKEIKTSQGKISHFTNPYIYENTMIGIKDSKLKALQFFNGTVETKEIYDFANPNSTIDFVAIEAYKVLIISQMSKSDFGVTFYLLNITEN